MNAVARVLLIAWLVLLAGFAAASRPGIDRARAAGLEIVEATAISEWPDGVRFRFEAQSEKPVDEVIVHFSLTGQTVTQYNYLDLAGGDDIAGEYFYRTGQRDRYIPPFTEFTYWYEVLYKDGSSEETDRSTLIAGDSRYEWQSVTDGPVTVYYHGPVEKRAQTMADIGVRAFEKMGPVTGADVATPARVIMYNNAAEMIGAISISSDTAARELITEGQAFAPYNLVIAQAGSDRPEGTVSHELTHVLVGRATSAAYSAVPTWLNEGLAEYGNLDQSVSYQRYLEWAIDTNRLVPIVYLDRFPADPNMTIVAYGEARSMVAFMVNTLGAQKMADLLTEINQRTPFAEAVERVYGFDLAELDSRWRLSIGAKPYVPPTETATGGLPTAIPRVELTPFTLSPTAAPGAAAATETPAATSTAEAPSTPEGSSGGCNRGNGGVADASAIGLLLLPATLLGLAAFRRLRSKV